MEKQEEQEKPGAAKLIGYLAAMTVVGVISFIILAVVAQARDHREVQPLPGPLTTMAQAGPPIAALQKGLRTLLEACRSNLENNRRADAMHALNGARHLAEIGQDAGASFAEAHRAIKEARHKIENGAPESASPILQKAIDALNATAPPNAPPLPPQIASYDGASVMNALGLRIGEVEAASSAQVQIKLGRQDVLGFIDLGGEPLTVPADRFVFGKKKGVGPTMVCLPLFVHESGEVRRMLGRQAGQR